MARVLKPATTSPFFEEPTMSRIRLPEDAELPADVAPRVQRAEAAGVDTASMRAFSYRQDMFDRYFNFYRPAHSEGVVEPDLKELVRLKIARLNDCFT
jgi:hypothetical protein